MTVPLLLVADVGGTNTRVSLSHGDRVQTDTITRFRNAQFPGLQEVLQRYLAQTGARPDGCCVAIAGPVRDGVGHMTNLDWEIDRDSLRKVSGAPRAEVLNDLQAQGHALDALPAGAFTPILAGGKTTPDAPRLVVGIGTGFNLSAVYTTPAGPYVTTSETGHIRLPVRNADDLDLVRFLSGGDWAEVEAAVSGTGLSRLHAWCCQRAGTEDPKTGAEVLSAARAGDPGALRAVALFTRLLGTILGDLALSYLPFGGIFLVGGAARGIAPLLYDHGFARHFADKGRFSGFMDDFALSVIEDDYAALLGCARFITAEERRP